METFAHSPSGKNLIRSILLPDGLEVRTRIELRDAGDGEDAQSAFEYAFLRKKNPPDPLKRSSIVRGADLFCGCGGLSLGALEACRAIGKRFVPLVAIDKDPIALKVYERNFRPKWTCADDIFSVLDGEIGTQITANETAFLEKAKSIKILLAGPPCQGYSSLNNFTRQNDGRNALYERVTRFVEISRPEHVLIENVPTVIHAKEGVVEKTINLMRTLGYNVDCGVANLAMIGVPQERKRHVVVASLSKSLSIEKVMKKHEVKRKRSVKWAIGDLEDEPLKSELSTPTNHSKANIRRMKFLHEKGIYDLPNYRRPPCHRNGEHGYKSMYGRMKLDEPSQTITSGFLSPGQGRYVHPTRLRTITPHEAARLQLFPDFFNFSDATIRRSLSRMIGNAAPMKLAYTFCLELLA